LQEDKEGLFDTCKTLSICLEIMSRFLESIKINSERLTQATGQGFMNATDGADYLVKKGISFREAYYAVGQAVKYSVENKKSLLDLNESEWKNFHPLFDLNLKEYLQPVNCLMQRESYGGTSPKEVKKQIEKVWAYIEKHRQTFQKEGIPIHESNDSCRWSRL
jgi:argininosuccinate lyase